MHVPMHRPTSPASSIAPVEELIKGTEAPSGPQSHRMEMHRQYRMELRWLHTGNRVQERLERPSVLKGGTHLALQPGTRGHHACLVGKERIVLAPQGACKDGFSGLKRQGRNLRPGPWLLHCSVQGSGRFGPSNLREQQYKTHQCPQVGLHAGKDSVPSAPSPWLHSVVLSPTPSPCSQRRWHTHPGSATSLRAGPGQRGTG